MEPGAVRPVAGLKLRLAAQQATVGVDRRLEVADGDRDVIEG